MIVGALLMVTGLIRYSATWRAAPPPKTVAEMSRPELEGAASEKGDAGRAAHDELWRRKYVEMAFSKEMLDRWIEQGGSIEDY